MIDCFTYFYKYRNRVLKKIIISIYYLIGSWNGARYILILSYLISLRWIWLCLNKICVCKFQKTITKKFQQRDKAFIPSIRRETPNNHSIYQLIRNLECAFALKFTYRIKNALVFMYFYTMPTSDVTNILTWAILLKLDLY